jgi:alpha-galactosidase
MMASPLMIGADVRNLDAETLALLTNKELIAINQDAECRPPFIPHRNTAHDWGHFYGDYYEPDTQACLPFFRHLENGEYALGFFNFKDDGAASSVFLLADYGLAPGCGYGLELTDVFTGKVEGVFDQMYRAIVPSHDCAIYRAKLVKL